MTELKILEQQRKDRRDTMATICANRHTMAPRTRLAMLNTVLNSLIDEHNAVTEPEGRFSEQVYMTTPLSLLATLDAWYAGGDLWDFIMALSPCVPYDPTLIAGCLPNRP